MGSGFGFGLRSQSGAIGITASIIPPEIAVVSTYTTHAADAACQVTKRLNVRAKNALHATAMVTRLGYTNPDLRPAWPEERHWLTQSSRLYHYDLAGTRVQTGECIPGYEVTVRMSIQAGGLCRAAKTRGRRKRG